MKETHIDPKSLPIVSTGAPVGVAPSQPLPTVESSASASKPVPEFQRPGGR
jgi:hypothetical protein